MAKEKKVSTRNNTTYASSSDDESSDDEIYYACLFKGLDRTKIDKINELIDALNEKNRLLEKQKLKEMKCFHVNYLHVMNLFLT
jgi:hypothetical protein